jgi:predicted ATPase
MRLLGRRAECEFLDAALANGLGGLSRVVVLRGEAGSGESVLLNFVVERAHGWRVATAVGIESEMELAYSGLHQLCAPMLVHSIGSRARSAMRCARCSASRRALLPDRFLVGLATLTLLAEVAEDEPLLCVIDDAQWLDAASAQIVLFVGRRPLAERIALVCAARTQAETEALDGLPELPVAGLRAGDARELLLGNLKAPFDAAGV